MFDLNFINNVICYFHYLNIRDDKEKTKLYSSVGFSRLLLIDNNIDKNMNIYKTFAMIYSDFIEYYYDWYYSY